MVLDGTESDINKNLPSNTNYLYWFRLPNEQSVLIGAQICACSHLNFVSYAPSGNVAISTTGTRIIYLNFGEDIVNAQPSGNTIAGLREYLADQYANGTPVTIWYVLATPTEETFTAPTITPSNGANTLTVDTTLPPSEVSITGTITQI